MKLDSNHPSLHFCHIPPFNVCLSCATPPEWVPFFSPQVSHLNL